MEQQKLLTTATDGISSLINAFGVALANAYRYWWDIGMKLMEGHWLQAFTILFVVFIIVLLWALLTRQWGSLGSFLYNSFYFGILLAIGFIFGPETYANDYFDIVIALLYPICWYCSRFFLEKFGFIGRNHYRH